MIGCEIANYYQSLNCSKTSYFSFSKHPHILANAKFFVHINHSEIEKTNSVKYLELLTTN